MEDSRIQSSLWRKRHPQSWSVDLICKLLKIGRCVPAALGSCTANVFLFLSNGAGSYSLCRLLSALLGDEQMTVIKNELESTFVSVTNS